MDIQRKTVPFTQVANSVLNDKRLSWKAKGLFAYIYSKPEGWDFSSVRITKDSTDGIDGVKAGLLELEKSGYLVRIRNTEKGLGRISYILNHELQGSKTGNAIEGISHKGKTPLRENPSSKQERLNTNKELFKKKDIAEASSAPWSLEESLKKMESKVGTHLDIIASFVREKPVRVENSAQLTSVIKRYSRIAKELAEAYKPEQIFKAIDKIKERVKLDERKGVLPVEWTLETVYKQLTK